ncbi:MAG: DUF6525 family protein [Pseudomonadota bacterium]
MASNRGTTSLKCRRTARNPMREFDRLPPELRRWVAGAMLPWRAATVRAAYEDALAKTGNPIQAIEALDALQQRLVAKDAASVWGGAHPAGRAA